MRGTIQMRPPAYIALRTPTEQHPLALETLQRSFENLLQLYYDWQVRGINDNNGIQLVLTGGLKIFGGASDGPWAARLVYECDTTPSATDWSRYAKEAIDLIPNAKKKDKDILRAIVRLSCLVGEREAQDWDWEAAQNHKRLPTTKADLGDLVVAVLSAQMNGLKASEAEKLVQKHLKSPKLLLPRNMELAIFFELARLFEEEDLSSKRNEWLERARLDSSHDEQIQVMLGAISASTDAMGCMLNPFLHSIETPLSGEEE